jgi:cytoplasmic iron level regulating protein YaaA (DUF328/UPF0246 family)
MELKMKILFSPSETKFKGGENIPLTAKSFIFPELFDSRMKAIQAYQNYIDTANQTQLAQLFGTAKLDVIEYYKGELLNKEIRKVIERYDGVAFDYLQYNMLSVPQKEYIDNNVMIFSNLFGPILAGDMGLPDYKLKQNEKIGEFALEKSNFWASGKTSIHTLWIALRECRQEHDKEWSRRIALGKENKALRLQIRELKLQTKTSKESK